jgi:hypothetical protein
MHHRHGLNAPLVLPKGVLDGRVWEVVGLEPREARDELQIVRVNQTKVRKVS